MMLQSHINLACGGDFLKEDITTNLTKDLLDEYFSKLAESKILNDEVSDLSKKIKYEMNAAKRKNISLYGYKIEVESKFEPNEEFIRLIYKNKLEHLITKSITTTDCRIAKRRLKLSDNDYYEKYAKEKDTKWLHVDKIE